MRGWRGLPRFDNARARAAHAAAVRLESMPVGDQRVPLGQIGHQPFRDEIAGSIEAGFAVSRVEFVEPAADRHVRADA